MGVTPLENASRRVRCNGDIIGHAVSWLDLDGAKEQWKVRLNNYCSPLNDYRLRYRGYDLNSRTDVDLNDRSYIPSLAVENVARVFLPNGNALVVDTPDATRCNTCFHELPGTKRSWLRLCLKYHFRSMVIFRKKLLEKLRQLFFWAPCYMSRLIRKAMQFA